ncbi:MAG TPA: M13 family metallopeptidase N-terminal domain-containing protein, partial [Bacteroidia bacterium]|nr:M13 family metallopeptidase N-terminal domain-containing protein [Bacteroidia bacterium]
MKKYLSPLALLVLIVAFTSCNTASKKADVIATDELVSHIDSTVKPGNDFFLYANGKWFKNNPIPNSEQQNGLWQLIQDTINAQILNLCKTSAALKNAEPGSNKQKIGDFYYSGMDSVTLNKNGISGLNEALAKIDNIKDLKGVIQTAAYIHTVAGAPLFHFSVRQDDKLSSKNMIAIEQGGLSLPNRDYYFDADKRATTVREKFLVHLTNMFILMGYDEKKARAATDNVMKLETAMAKTSRKKEDTRDPLKNYNKITYKQLQALTPNLDWSVFMDEVNLHNVDSVMVGQPEFLTALNGELKSFSLDDWKNYLRFHLVDGLAPYTDDKTYMEHFSFYGTALRGIKEPQPRWKRVVESTDDALGELIGQV